MNESDDLAVGGFLYTETFFLLVFQTEQNLNN